MSVRRLWVAKTRAVLLVISLLTAAMLAGCGAAGAIGGVAETTTLVLVLWLTLIGALLSGCGSGSAAGQIQAGNAATTSSAGGSSVPARTTAVASPSPSPSPAIVGTQLVFVSQPRGVEARGAQASQTLSSIEVAVEDANGNVVTTATNAITIALDQNPHHATLLGTLTVNAVDGIATFSNLRLSVAGAGYTFKVTASGLTSAQSTSFVIAPLALSYDTARRDYATNGVGLYSVVAGNFVNGGPQDLCVVARYSGEVEVMLGQGDGTFITGESFPTQFSPSYAVASDFNHDGNLDLAVASYGTTQISILLGNGDGTFQSAQNITVDGNPFNLAVGNFSGEGNGDLVTVNQNRSVENASTISVLLGNGDGSFRSPQNYGTPGQNHYNFVTVGDFTGNGHDDIAASTYGPGSALLTVFINNGDGTFQASTNTATNGGSEGVVATAFVAGGPIDLALGNNDNMLLFNGNGDGTFQAARDIQATPEGDGIAYYVGTGDLNGDGIADLFLTDYNGRSVSVLLGNGDATFKAPLSAPVGQSPFGATVGNFRGKGAIDIATANYHPSTLAVLLGNGDGTFPTVPTVAVGAQPQSVVMADFNGDGHPDIAVANYASNTVSVCLGNGDGTFAAALNFAVGSEPTNMVAMDVNGDQRVDLVCSNAGSGTLSVLLGNGDGTFQSPLNVPVGGTPSMAALGDVNGDGRLDLAVANRGNGLVSILLGNGDGTFQSPQNFNLGSSVESVGLADFNGDHKLDFAAVVSGQPGEAIVMLGNGDGTFHQVQNVPLGASPIGLAIADLNNDGRVDLAIANSGGTSNVSILLGNGDGTFQSPQTVGLGGVGAMSSGASPVDAGSLIATDVNLDGIPDLVMPISGDIGVLIGNGDGTFKTVVLFGTSSAVQSVAVGDLLGTGRPDLVGADALSNAASILLQSAPSSE